MSEMDYAEEPLQFGIGGRLLGILTSPAGRVTPRPGSPTFVLLSAGLLHRVGPGRLHVRLARSLAATGVSTLRVDLSGKGDSPRRQGLANQESVGADYDEISALLAQRSGGKGFVIVGICSGADNAVRLALADERVRGLVLMDPICPKDDGFARRARWRKLTVPANYLRYARRLLRRATKSEGPAAPRMPSPLELRDLPTTEQVRGALSAVGARKGRVLAVFTSYARNWYYNRHGQLRDAMALAEFDAVCRELYWEEVNHTFGVERHRRRLIDEVLAFARQL